jgi:hypothetical protein
MIDTFTTQQERELRRLYDQQREAQEHGHANSPARPDCRLCARILQNLAESIAQLEKELANEP